MSFNLGQVIEDNELKPGGNLKKYFFELLPFANFGIEKL